jgi:hypothetical protein
MKFIKIFLSLGIMFGMSSGMVQAHHSATMFDFEKEITITGVVKEFQYTNPHAWLIVTVVDGSGGETNWSVELGAPTLLRAAGVGKKTFLPGDEYTLKIHPMKDGRPAGEHISITKPDGSPAY